MLEWMNSDYLTLTWYSWGLNGNYPHKEDNCNPRLGHGCRSFWNDNSALPDQLVINLHCCRIWTPTNTSPIMEHPFINSFDHYWCPATLAISEKSMGEGMNGNLSTLRVTSQHTCIYLVSSQIHPSKTLTRKWTPHHPSAESALTANKNESSWKEVLNLDPESCACLTTLRPGWILCLRIQRSRVRGRRPLPLSDHENIARAKTKWVSDKNARCGHSENLRPLPPTSGLQDTWFVDFGYVKWKSSRGRLGTRLDLTGKWDSQNQRDVQGWWYKSRFFSICPVGL